MEIDGGGRPDYGTYNRIDLEFHMPSLRKKVSNPNSFWKTFAQSNPDIKQRALIFIHKSSFLIQSTKPLF